MLVLGNIFYDYKGDFMWSSVAAGVSLIAAILSIVGVIVGICINRKTQKDIAKQQIDANLKAKARIDWITEVRELVSVYIYELAKVQNIMIKMNTIEKILSAYRTSPTESSIAKAEETNQKLTELYNEFELVYYNYINISERILLHFSEKKEHKYIEESVKNAVEIVKDIYIKAGNRAINNPNASIDERDEFSKMMTTKIEQTSNDIRNVFRSYLKKEWDIAKEGK